MKKLIATVVLATALPLVSFASGDSSFEKQEWGFQGLPKGWDKNQLKRGYQVATEVCMNCHSFKYVSHRNLMGVGFSEDEVKEMAEWLDLGIDDKLISALSDEDAIDMYAKPLPDLSVMNKARAGGADYIYAVLTGYDIDVEELPNGDPLPEGTSYNEAFPGHAIAMPEPLFDEAVEYEDGTEPTLEQHAKDVAYFMQWTAEPELMKRKRLGLWVLGYIFIFTCLAYFTKRVIWKDIK